MSGRDAPIVQPGEGDLGPGGVGDGLPALPSGEPLLPRWFVIPMVVLVPLGIAVTVWAFASVGRDPLPVAERRPPGTARITHERGDAALNQTIATEPGPDCASAIEVFGDEGARAAGGRALSGVCQMLWAGDLPAVERGLRRWGSRDGRLRFAVFELTGADSSARIEGDRVVVELNARFQFENATEAAPFVVHELAHLGGGAWPGDPVDAAGELAATRAQRAACDLIAFADQPPRGCGDAEQLLALDDPLAALRAAGYPGPSRQPVE